ncbi:MAG: hypothetical protein DHS20C15_26460 [Planctomycetota bacterium]|nr:MAG: hypothetical protein DHS20C15_26460 [Planctomycetota bacterium]
MNASQVGEGQKVEELKTDLSIRGQGPWAPRLAAVSLVVSSTVLVGWQLENATLVQVLPDLAPMQFNTALGIALCSIALLLRRSRLSAVAAAGAFALAVASFAQYVGGWDFGLDTLFIEPWTTVRTSNPGRMAPSTAMAMTLTAGALLSLQLRQRKLLASILGTMVMALGGMALLGYALDFSAAYRWGHLTDMAVHTSLCWMLLGLGTIHASIGSRSLFPDATVREPLIAGVLCSFAFVVHSVALAVLVGGHDDRLESLLNTQAQVAALHLERTLDEPGATPREQLDPAALERALLGTRAALMTGLHLRLEAPGGHTLHSPTDEALAGTSWNQHVDVAGTRPPWTLVLQPSKAWVAANRSRTGESLMLIGAATAVLCALFSRKWVHVLRATRAANATATRLSLEVGHHREAREALARSNEQLLEQEGKLDMALRASEIGSWEWDLQTNLLSIDARLEQILEVEPGSLNGPYSLWESLIQPASRGPLREAIAATRRGSPPNSIDFRVITPRGQTRDLTARGAILSTEGDRPERIVGLCIDITRRLKVERELERSNSDLEEFAYAASHDLQEPLRMVTSFCEVVDKRYHDKIDDDGKRYLGYAVEGARRMQRLVAELLTLARVGRSEQPRELVDVGAACAAIVREAADSLKQDGGEIHVGPMPVIYACQTELERLMRNLIMNALRYGGDSPRVEVGSELRGTEQVMWVRDHGPGIDPRYHSRIFHAFKRLGTRAQTGSGIGLALCRKIVDHHEGRIWVESKLGEGATFFVALPVLPTQNMPEDAAADPSRSTQPASSRVPTH